MTVQPGGDGASLFYGLWPGGDEHVSRSTVRGYVPAGKPNIGATAESPTTGPLRTQLSERAWRKKRGTEGDFCVGLAIRMASHRHQTEQTQYTQARNNLPQKRVYSFKFKRIAKELQKNCTKE